MPQSCSEGEVETARNQGQPNIEGDASSALQSRAHVRAQAEPVRVGSEQTGRRAIRCVCMAFVALNISV